MPKSGSSRTAQTESSDSNCNMVEKQTGRKVNCAYGGILLEIKAFLQMYCNYLMNILGDTFYSKPVGFADLEYDFQISISF